MSTESLYFVLGIDCEATQPALRDAALGERSTRGFGEMLESHGLRGSFYVIPSDIEAHANLYRDLKRRGHEVGLHIHPAADGYAEFLGVYGADDQRTILGEATDRFAQAMGYRPTSFCPGYASANDHTFGVLFELGYRQGITTIPSRVLPECASIHAGAPLEPHYAHRHNRALVGDLDFVEVPYTLDPDSRMWGGKHPQDLRVELVDAKNHFYTIEKAVKRQIAESTPLKSVRAATHNTFEFGDPKDFRRQTLEGIIQHTYTIAERNSLKVVPATIVELANTYRKTVPLGSTVSTLKLDRRAFETQKVGA